MGTDRATIETKPIVALTNFFSYPGRPCTLKEFQEFWKSVSNEEREEFRQAIQKWDGESEFVK